MSLLLQNNIFISRVIPPATLIYVVEKAAMFYYFITIVLLYCMFIILLYTRLNHIISPLKHLNQIASIITYSIRANIQSDQPNIHWYHAQYPIVPTQQSQWNNKVEEPVITFQQQHLRTEHFGQATLYKMLKQTGTSQEEVSTPMVPRTTNNATQIEIKQVRVPIQITASSLIQPVV